jgi:hypothetical protein
MTSMDLLKGTLLPDFLVIIFFCCLSTEEHLHLHFEEKQNLKEFDSMGSIRFFLDEITAKIFL